MGIYYFDKALFLSYTGVDHSSVLGSKFRLIARKNLQSMQQQLINDPNCDYGEFSHKLVGIASSCGLKNAARVCSKLEIYHTILKDKKNIYIFNSIISNLIKILY